ncbi:hypothetical protein, partial [Pseudomonas syringae group genomosp. 7]|uniref:hypothetical protein n=1 Tax=Pseudomonas syringae group genomosp. 7 TaxID=251699 RepID=UPI00376FDA6D
GSELVREQGWIIAENAGLKHRSCSRVGIRSLTLSVTSTHPKAVSHVKEHDRAAPDSVRNQLNKHCEPAEEYPEKGEQPR